MIADHKRPDINAQPVFISALIHAGYRGATMLGMNTIGSRVKLLRKGRKMTQVALAKALGVTQPALSMIETGDTASLSGEMLAGICRELTTTPDFVLYGSGSAENFEAAMQVAEVTRIMHGLTAQAREALLSQARLVAKATNPPAPGAIALDNQSAEPKRSEQQRGQLLNPIIRSGRDRRQS